MTAPWMILSFILPCLLGWFISLAGIRFIRSGRWIGKLDLFSFGSLLERELLSTEFLKDNLLSPENYQKLVPQVETHIDHFLRVRLKEDMPVVGSMIGDRTISQMKGIFLKEMEQLFPEVMEGYLNNMKSDHTIARVLGQKLGENQRGLAKELTKPFIREFSGRIQIFGALAGLVFGMLQFVMYFLFRV